MPKTMLKEVSERAQALVDFLNYLLAASGVVSKRLKDDDPVSVATDELLRLAENALCREDRAEYKDWALEMTELCDGLVWEPCDAWWEGDLPEADYLWIEESVTPDA